MMNHFDDLTFEDIIESFTERLENGERPSIQEYQQKFPQFADRIENVLGALVALENVDSNPTDRKLIIDDSIPEVIGDYRIVQEVGRGGMGIVFEAQHSTMRRRVALKVLPKSSADKPNYLSRFLTEARSAGQLHHTNIVPVFEVGEADGLHYYAMQFIHGDNLDHVVEDIKLLRRQSKHDAGLPNRSVDRDLEPTHSKLSQSIAEDMLGSASQVQTVPKEDDKHADEKSQNNDTLARRASLTTTRATLVDEKSVTSQKGQNEYHRRVASVGVQVAEALAHAHEHGVLHRDVKPANLILDTDGNVWVTDFGLAKLDSNDMTQTGDIIGTLRYMAPERFAGEADARSDIYSLGLTLYELCTLKCAFQNDRGTLVHDVANSSSVVHPRKIDETIPQDLETIILKAIEAQPDRRYQTANDLRTDLKLFLNDRPIKARRASWMERLWRICRRNPVAASLSACLLALLLVITLGSIEFARRQFETRKETQSNLYESRFDQARMRLFSGRPGQRLAALDAIKDAVDLLPELELTEAERKDEKYKLRTEAVAALSLTDLRPVWSYSPTREYLPGNGFALSPDYRHLVVCNLPGNVLVKNIEDGSERSLPVLKPSVQSRNAQMSNDSRYLLVRYFNDWVPTHKQVTVVWDLERLEAPVVELQGCHAAEFCPRSERLAVTFNDRVDFFELQTGKLTKSFVPEFLEEGIPYRLRFGSAGKSVAVSGSRTGEIEIWNIEHEPEIVKALSIGDERIYVLAWDSTRKILAVGTEEGNLFWWRTGYDAEPSSMPLHQNTVHKVYIHPTKDWVITEAWDSTIRMTDILAGEQVLQIEGDQLLSIGFSPDGRLGFKKTASLEYGIWEFSEPLLDVFRLNQGNGWKVRFHPVHKNLIACSAMEGASGVVDFWDVGQARLVHRIEELNARELRFTKDGNYLFVSGKDGLHKFKLNVTESEEKEVEVEVVDRQTLVDKKIGHMLINRSEDEITYGFGSSIETVSAEDGSLIRQFGKHSKLTRIQFSADERHLLSGTWHGLGIKVWEVESGKEVAQSFEDRRSVVPTAHPLRPGYYLACNSDNAGFSVVQIGLEENARKLEHFAFQKVPKAEYSSNGKLLAASSGSFHLLLIDPVTMLPMTKFRTFDSARLIGFEFSSDLDKVALMCFDTIQILDLKKYRSELSELGLDW